MDVATSSNRVGVRDLKNNLSRHLERVKEGEELIVTDRGRAVARVVPIDRSTTRLEEMIANGQARPAPNRGKPRRPLPEPIKTEGTVSDLVAEQRR